MNQEVEFFKAFASLTPRQLEVLLKLLDGEEDAEIAGQLYIGKDTVKKHISENTVKKHIQKICDTLLGPNPDPGYSRRDKLISLIAKYRPELIGLDRCIDPKRPQVLLSFHQSPESDSISIAQLYAALKAHGYEVFLADGGLRMAKKGQLQIYSQLNQCHYLLLLLSPLSAVSEMVTEEVQVAKRLQDSQNSGKPVIIPLGMNCSFTSLNHHLRNYLQGLSWYEWRSPDDTQTIIQTILELLSSTHKSESVKSGTPIARSSAHAAVLKEPPQPIAEPELPMGQVDLASVFYVERPNIDRRCYAELVKPGALIRIKAPRQMGKTSLMARILHQAKAQGYATVPLSFQLADSKTFTDLEQFLQWFCINVARLLELPERLADYWKGNCGSKMACKTYFEQYLLANTTCPLVLGLDEVDVVFKYPEVATDFFSLLRACHEAAKTQEIWRKLLLVVVHSTEVYVPLDINLSPFNVGLPIDLPEFQPAIVLQLAQRHELAWELPEVEQLMAMVGGHPYLVRLALYHIARSEATLEEVLEAAPTDAGLYGDHLRRHLWNLEQHPQLVAAVKQVVDTPDPVQLKSTQAFKLHSMGLVNLHGNKVTPRCNLYRQYFQVRL
ncbi:MAG: hypothetical protein Fur006_13530 [Coleofasciculaceae cyanobacterium]